MKLSVTITFLTSLYTSKGFVKNDLEYFANQYHSTGSVVWFKGDDPCLYCECSEDDLKQLAIDIAKYDGKIQFRVSTTSTELHNWKR